jgi:hypothetical protein
MTETFASIPESPRLVVFHIPQEDNKENSTLFEEDVELSEIGINTEESTNDLYIENSKLIIDETNMRILINMNSKIEKMSFRIKKLIDKNNNCIDCLCRCFSCTSFILSIISFIK